MVYPTDKDQITGTERYLKMVLGQTKKKFPVVHLISAMWNAYFFVNSIIRKQQCTLSLKETQTYDLANNHLLMF